MASENEPNTRITWRATPSLAKQIEQYRKHLSVQFQDLVSTQQAMSYIVSAGLRALSKESRRAKR